jgi:hypothetical protein
MARGNYQKFTQSGDQWETPQIVPEQLATETYGGMAPTAVDVIKSANARAQKRHEMKSQEIADVEVLPDSSELVGDERIGIRNFGYLSKKNTPYGVNAFFNSLPPGMDIEDQEMCDIRQEKMRIYEGGLGYPGDGWVVRRRGKQAPGKVDKGRPDETNYMGSNRRNPPKVTGAG